MRPLASGRRRGDADSPLQASRLKPACNALEPWQQDYRSSVATVRGRGCGWPEKLQQRVGSLHICQCVLHTLVQSHRPALNEGRPFFGCSLEVVEDPFIPRSFRLVQGCPRCVLKGSNTTPKASG